MILPRSVQVVTGAFSYLGSYIARRVMGPLLKDVLITREEIKALMDGLLVSSERPSCKTRFSEWITDNAENPGKSYASEIGRHFK